MCIREGRAIKGFESLMGRKKQILRQTILNKKETGASIDYEKTIEEIYEYTKQGLRKNEIFSMLLVDDPNMTHAKFGKLIQDTVLFAQAAVQKDRDYVFNLHMNRYGQNGE